MKPLLAAVLLFAASAPALAQESPYTRIFMERTACYGTCPVYSVELRENGSVTYTGTQYVRVSGTRRWTVDAQAVQSLARDMARAGFFDWKDEYTAPVMDLPTTYVTLTAGGRTKKIKDHLGAPPALKEIEARIDAVSGARGYVAIDAAAVRDMVAKGWRPTGGDAVRWLQIALSSGDAETVRALLAAGMNARAADDEGVTLVMRAVESGDPETVRAVLAAGGDPTARDRSGRNAADRARDGLARTSRGLVAATGRPRDFALILRLLTDE